MGEFEDWDILDVMDDVYSPYLRYPESFVWKSL